MSLNRLNDSAMNLPPLLFVTPVYSGARCLEFIDRVSEHTQIILLKRLAGATLMHRKKGVPKIMESATPCQPRWLTHCARHLEMKLCYRVQKSEPENVGMSYRSH
jgi:hypothetical protein